MFNNISQYYVIILLIIIVMIFLLLPKEEFSNTIASNMFKTMNDWSFIEDNNIRVCKTNGQVRAEIKINDVTYSFCYIPSTLPTTVTNFTNNDFKTYFLKNPNVSNVVFFHNGINLDRYEANNMFKTISDWSVSANSACNSKGNIKAEININGVIYRFCYNHKSLPTAVTNFTNNDFKTYFLTNPNVSNVVFLYYGINVDQYGNASIMFKTISDWDFTQYECITKDKLRAEIKIDNVTYRFCYNPTTLPTTVTKFSNNDFKIYFLTNPNVSNVVFYYNNMTFEQHKAKNMFKTITDWDFRINACNSKGNIKADININGGIYSFCYKPTTLPTTVTKFSNNDFKIYFLTNPNVSNIVFYYNGINVDQYGASIMFKNIGDWNFSSNGTCNNISNIRAEININNVIYLFCYIPTSLPKTVTNFTNNDFKTYFLIDPNVSNVVFYYNNMTVDRYGVYQPEPKNDNPQKPTTDYPQKPTTDYPQKPTTDYPQKPTTDNPQKPTTDNPQKPTTDNPQKPTTDNPQKPTTDNPQKPTTDNPQKPTTDNPQKPTTDNQTIYYLK